MSRTVLTEGIFTNSSLFVLTISVLTVGILDAGDPRRRFDHRRFDRQPFSWWNFDHRHLTIVVLTVGVLLRTHVKVQTKHVCAID